MMRLRLNLPFQDLAYRFNISTSTASRTFDKWIDVIVIVLKFLIKWRNREELQKTMPTDFVQVYDHKVAVIIDCFEVLIVGNITFCFVDSPKSETLLCIRDASSILGMID